MKKQLVFDTSEDFQQYISENNISMKDLQIFEAAPEVVPEEKPIVVEPIVESIYVKLISLHDNPVFNARVSDHNVLYVDDLQINEDCCQPAKVNVLGRTLSVILCNQDGKTKASLNVAIKDVPRYDVVFEVKKQNGDLTMEIAKDILEHDN